jgi:transcriptional antiterminator RfaH
MSSGERWYVVETHAHAEAKAAAHLARQGFKTYLPRYQKRRRHARRIDTIAAPLFPRYLFVAIDMAAQRWHSIRSTLGVTRLVSSGDLPSPIASNVIDGLKNRENDAGYVRLETRINLAQGDTVRVVSGAFAACLGLFEGITDGERVAILLEFLGRKVRIVVDAASVAAV